ncbi:heme ABC exporter ATP-binding protein CcmA [Anaplasma phagocytophilum]|uniref:heme ABC exporter ATP-binding protein CcmA n=1 Tax=Anaplasma phagocytophilum TaxID=948 RepID=UPI00200DB547|nr:heme ABC exporter ATP-binding protein CcmA [Anaplasma phagocytophilum]UQD54161.1 heme ABC exporter ATP-binding protein CcmA [Anaplasma phagocytophilum]
MIECSNVTCVRGERVLFRNLSFIANQGSITVIAGKNGSGKTSLLRSMVGLVPVRFGKITLNGEAITTSSTCISDITYIGHKNACHEHLMVVDILEFWANTRGNDNLIPAAVNFFELHRVLHTKFRHLSSGWKRKVALSRLLIFNTHVWIMDEPFANLDSASVAMLKELILTRAERGGTIILADHNHENTFSQAQVVNLAPEPQTQP